MAVQTNNPAPSNGASLPFYRRYGWVIAGLVIAAAVVLILAPAASENPDGLDRVSQDEEFADKAKGPSYEWLPDYTIPGVDNEWASVVLAVLVGVAIVFLVPLGIGFALRQTRKSRP